MKLNHIHLHAAKQGLKMDVLFHVWILSSQAGLNNIFLRQMTEGFAQ